VGPQTVFQGIVVVYCGFQKLCGGNNVGGALPQSAGQHHKLLMLELLSSGKEKQLAANMIVSKLSKKFHKQSACERQQSTVWLN